MGREQGEAAGLTAHDASLFAGEKEKEGKQGEREERKVCVELPHSS